MNKAFKKVTCILTIILCMALCLHSSASAQGGTGTAFVSEHSQLIKQFESLADAAMKASGIPGMSIALVDDKEILWAEGFGYTDQSHSRAVDADTIFSIQSISKTITATAVVEACGKGLLDLDKPITEYLPDFTVNSVFEEHPERKITLRKLLSHTAGLTIEAPVGSNYDADARSFEDHIRSISSTWLRCPAGQDYTYSNLGVDLSGYILQKASGQSFQSYVDQNLTGLIGMTKSTFDMAKIKKNVKRAIGYSSGHYKMPLEIPMIPSGGFYSSANDMAKFIQHHLNNSGTLAEMYEVPALVEGQTEGCALGVGVTRRYNTYYLSHGGGGFGFFSSLIWYPELKIGVVVLTNCTDTPVGYVEPYDLGHKILDAVIADSSTVYHSRQEQLPMPAKPVISGLNFNSKLISDVTQGLNAVKDKPLPDASRYSGYIGTYTQQFAGIPFFYGIVTLSEQNGYLYMDGAKLTEVQTGLFFTNNGEALDLRGSNATFRNITMQKLTFGLTFTLVLVAGCFVIFIAAIVLLIVRRKKCRAVTPGRAAAAPRVLQGAGLGVYVLFIASFAYLAVSLLSMAGSQQGLQTYHTVAALILVMKVLSPLVLLFTAVSVFFCILAWIKKYWSEFDRISYLFVTTFGILFILIMFRLNVVLL